MMPAAFEVVLAAAALTGLAVLAIDVARSWRHWQRRRLERKGGA